MKDRNESASPSEPAKPVVPGVAPPSAAASTLGNLGTRLISYPLAFATGIVLARVLGPHDRGVFAFLQLFVDFFLPLGSFGFGAAVLYFVAGKHYRFEDIGFTAIMVGIFQGTAIALIIYGLHVAHMLGDTGNAISRRMVLAMLAILPVRSVTLIIQRYLIGRSMFAATNILEIIRNTVYPVLMIGALLLGNLGLEGAVAAYWVICILELAAIVYLMRRTARLALRIDVAFVRAALSYGTASWFTDLMTRINLRLDRFVTGAYVSASALGSYTIASSLTEMLWIGSDALGPVLFTRASATSNLAQRAALTERIHRMSILAMCCGGLALATLCPWFISLLYGASYADAVLPTVILIPGTVGMVSIKVLSKYFGSVGRPALSGVVFAVAVVSSGIAYVLLVPRWGIVGASIGTSIGYASTLPVSVILYRKLLRPRQAQLFRPDASDRSWTVEQLRRALRHAPFLRKRK